MKSFKKLTVSSNFAKSLIRFWFCNFNFSISKLCSFLRNCFFVINAWFWSFKDWISISIMTNPAINPISIKTIVESPTTTFKPHFLLKMFPCLLNCSFQTRNLKCLQNLFQRCTPYFLQKVDWFLSRKILEFCQLFRKQQDIIHITMTYWWNERSFCLNRGFCNNQELIALYCMLIVFQLSIKMINPINLEFVTFFVIE